MPRESMKFDIIIVGAGPAGLSAAIRLAQQNKSLSICIIEKAASMGGHVVSGAVLDPRALTELIPDWQNKNAPLNTTVNHDEFWWLQKNKKYNLPKIAALNNHGNYIISLVAFTQWLAEQAEQLGVQIFTGFAGKNLIIEENTILGVTTGDMGIDKKGEKTNRFQDGIDLLAKHTLLAEGCRGSLSQQLIKQFNLDQFSQLQTYGIGLKEVWRIEKNKHQPGKVVHTVGWPLDQKTYGGGFIYHYAEDKISLGMVIGLDYKNPSLDPFEELQQFKRHPNLADLLKNGECLSYGARALNEGGWQSLPNCTAPGATLIGDAAGTLNVAKIKGIHTAMQSGLLAADELLKSEDFTLKEFNHRLRTSWVGEELYHARNIRPGFHRGLWIGLILAGIDQIFFKGKAPWTLIHHTADNKSLLPKNKCSKIIYPKPDHQLTFTKSTQVNLCHINHEENQPCHLILKNKTIATEYNLKKYGGPEQYYCPAGVYEFIKKDGKKQLQINSQNCIHCKTCDIKDPKQNIIWTPPEGGSGPNYLI